LLPEIGRVGEIIMSPPEEDFDDFDNDELWGFTPKKAPRPEYSPIPLSPHRTDDINPQNQAPESGQLPWKRSRDNPATPQSIVAKPTQPPWKRSSGPFAGEGAIVGMRDKALMATLLSAPPAPPFGRKYGIALWLTVPLAVGIVGYELGSDPLPPRPQFVSHSNRLERSGSVSGQSQQSDVSVKLTTSSANASSIKSEPHQLNTSAIATKMKKGAELMTYGKIIKAREMFRPVAEAGEGAGAFALAETYDPIELEGLRLTERIAPDLMLAHSWYERARDLGSLDARDRISRLAQSPQ
jgi:hypothetical protein